MYRECCVCSHFTGYYTKAYCGFNKERCGHCRLHDKTVDKHDTCENFKNRLYKEENTIKHSAVINALSQAITEINTIKTLLENYELKK